MFARLATLAIAAAGATAGAIVATASSVSWPFDPVAVDRFVTTELVRHRIPGLAQGHVMAYGNAVSMPELSGFLGGSGGVVSTASDMAHYLIAQGNHGIYSGRTVLSEKGISLMQTPPVGVASNYAMGWTKSSVHGTTAVEHNGILSTFYADAVLLPASGHGVVLLYNAYGLTAATLAFPEIKEGLVMILTGRVPDSGGLSLSWLGRGLAILSAMIVALAFWSMLRPRQWNVGLVNAPNWKVLWGVLWPVAPALVLVSLPRLLLLQTGRYFDLGMLSRAMPELVALLGVGAALGLSKSLIRLVMLARPPALRRPTS